MGRNKLVLTSALIAARDNTVFFYATKIQGNLFVTADKESNSAMRYVGLIGESKLLDLAQSMEDTLNEAIEEDGVLHVYGLNKETVTYRYAIKGFYEENIPSDLAGVQLLNIVSQVIAQQTSLTFRTPYLGHPINFDDFELPEYTPAAHEVVNLITYLQYNTPNVGFTMKVSYKDAGTYQTSFFSNDVAFLFVQLNKQGEVVEVCYNDHEGLDFVDKINEVSPLTNMGGRLEWI